MKATLKTTLFFPLLCFIFVLTGCSSGSSSSSGGGVSSGGGQAIPIFASWDSVSPSSSVQSHSVTISADGEEPRNETITLAFDEQAQLNQFTIGSDAQEQVFEHNRSSNITAISRLSLFTKSSDEKDWLISFNPTVEGWKYHSMALWLDVKTGNNIDVGVLSFSSTTQNTDMPTRPNLRFSGKSIGLYIDGNDNDKRYLTQATITANLQGNIIELDATDTYRWSTSSPDITNISNKTRDTALDFMTNLTYNSSDNSFDANNIEINGGALTGTVKAKLYGPVGQELGGVFKMRDNDGSRYSGAFGTKFEAQ
ncbi:MAG: transferrin-binding protein-like solute binding protein [Alphaproteobacteria bacterium]|nr:transferrin-binding protein-like solute binding protein [Alphaproteobacteria bacterium]